ncbi:four-carbon acid sugar kinase family protein [Streptomyces sp. NEAU-YJ-81]|uniref:four-carbon acid sugar kinase family protein n=1 Tax=Streptomyces sp. NEAU-YJ-81 TaxID=2820288 RepID=UPI0027E0957E|nr:four-carbon acid sugar kinase family protein [Streptomyces sp. NEAU-YJ-81]
MTARFTQYSSRTSRNVCHHRHHGDDVHGIGSLRPSRSFEEVPVDMTPSRRLLAIADDLSGAAEVAAALCSRTTRSRVLLVGRPDVVNGGVVRALHPRHPGEATVLDLDSRYRPATEAAEAVRDALRLSSPDGEADGDTDGDTLVLKKIDSLLRGNVAAEIAALAEGGAGVVLAPALPIAGRVVRSGVVHIGGVALHEGDAWRAETLPPPASVAQALRGLPTALIPLTTVRASPPTLLAALRAAVAAGRVAICDAETDADLDAVVEASLAEGPRMRLVGSGGLAAALGRHLTTAPAATTTPAAAQTTAVLAAPTATGPAAPDPTGAPAATTTAASAADTAAPAAATATATLASPVATGPAVTGPITAPAAIGATTAPTAVPATSASAAPTATGKATANPTTPPAVTDPTGAPAADTANPAPAGPAATGPATAPAAATAPAITTPAVTAASTAGTTVPSANAGVAPATATPASFATAGPAVTDSTGAPAIIDPTGAPAADIANPILAAPATTSPADNDPITAPAAANAQAITTPAGAAASTASTTVPSANAGAAPAAPAAATATATPAGPATTPARAAASAAGTAAPSADTGRPVLVVVGTAEPSAAEQIRRLVEDGATHHRLPPAGLLSDGPPLRLPPLTAPVTVVSLAASPSPSPVAPGLAPTHGAAPIPSPRPEREAVAPADVPGPPPSPAPGPQPATAPPSGGGTARTDPDASPNEDPDAGPSTGPDARPAEGPADEAGARSRPVSGRRLVLGLARAIGEAVAAHHGAVDLVLTGGETARRVLDALAVTELDPVGEVHHGAVHLSTPDGRSVVTRPGSFGDPDSLRHIVQALRPHPMERKVTS